MIIQGDCIEKLKTLPENSVDSIVTDPPYHLTSIVKRFGKKNSAPAKFGTDGVFKRASTGFMGKTWDGGDIAFNTEMWKECLRVLKPGGYLLSFGGTRTYHRMACAIEDAGFEVRDMIEWVYSTGFPKSLNVYKHLQKKCKCGNMEVYENRIKQMGKDSEAETEYFLRFMQEADLSQTISPEKKQGKVLQSGLSEQSSHRTVQGEEPEESSKGREKRVLERGNNTKKTEGELQGSDLSEMPERVFGDGEERRIHNATQAGDGSAPKQTINENGSSASQGPQSEQQQYREPCAFCKQWGTQAIRTLGVGTSTKPAHEPICLARKPLEEKTVAENVLKYGTGGINIDESRVETNGKDLEKLNSEWDREWNTDYSDYADKVGGSAGFNMDKAKKENAGLTGRFPANLIHDNSEEVRECFPDLGRSSKLGNNCKSTGGWSTGLKMSEKGKTNDYSDSGNASRFFKSIKKPYVYSGKEYEVEGFIKNCKPQAPSNYNDEGSPARYFKSIIYTAKASKAERNRGCEGLEAKVRVRQGLAGEKKDTVSTNSHPTVKPVALMRYLIKLITPPKGIVLDPFMGSGSTGIAAKLEGFDFIGIEKEPEYVKIAEARIKAWEKEPQQDKLL